MPRSRHWNRRKRRLRRMALVLAAVAVAAAVAGWLLYRARRPEVRRPGEALADVTRRLEHNLPADAPEPRFTDVTAAAGLAGFRGFAGGRSSQLPEDMGSGVAWGDFDNDGDDDLFVVAAGGALTLPPTSWEPSRLFENLGDGTFRRVGELPELRLAGMAAAWGDVDGDGWLDLAVSGYRRLVLLRNRGGRLAVDEAFTAPDGYWAGLSWADFDGDSDLDLYVCGYVRYVEDAGDGRKASQQYGRAVPYTLNPASFEPERNLLLQNDGRGGFTEVAALYGVSNPEGRSLSALWHDFDQDGRLDLYVANDISDNALYLNRGESFEDAGLSAWVADYRGAMGLAAGDWNRDGDDDLFVTHWLAQENALYDSRLAETRGAAAVPLSFTDRSAPLGLGQISLQSVGWGTEFADFDGDGWLDLLVANGSTLETDDRPPRLRPQPMMVLWSRRGEAFHDLAQLHPGLAEPRVGRGLAVADYDRDGDPDFAVVELDGGVRLWRNDMPQDGWLGLRLQGAGALGRGEGATVTIESGGASQRRTVGGASYLSQSSATLHFGLGAATAAERVSVSWPGGEQEEFGGLAGGAFWVLEKGSGAARRLAAAAASPAALPSQRAEGAAGDAGERQRLVAFWSAQRAAMDAFKRHGDCGRAVPLFREALALEPGHEDSRYYLANCLAAEGDPGAALGELATLRELSPMSHRAHRQWGVLRALAASGPDELREAEAAVERSLEINPEETGSLLVLGEIALLLERPDLAERRLELACRTNPRAVGGFFLRAYLAWRRGDSEGATVLLAAAREARGEEWKPAGATAEGDVAGRAHRERTPLSDFWQLWDGALDPGPAFAALDERLARR